MILARNENQYCGNCRHHQVMDMNQGEVTEVRCAHPSIQLIRDHHDCPDWVYDKNAFGPRDHGNYCHTWAPEIDTNLNDRIDRLETQIRTTTLELGCLSNMGMNFIERAVKYYQDKIVNP